MMDKDSSQVIKLTINRIAESQEDETSSTYVDLESGV